jgi:hypothetical protein
MTSEARLLGKPTPWHEVKGFNYQPSYGTTGYELWTRFDAERIDLELARARKHFPAMNALRWWLSWDAFGRDKAGFERNFETALQLAEQHGMAVMPVLFNRWHSPVTDFGGIYVDHFLPGACVVQNRSGRVPGRLPWSPQDCEPMFDEFLERIVGAHAGDERIFTWDVCNEPFLYQAPLEYVPQLLVDAELAWLTRMSEACKRLDPDTPRGVSIHSLHDGRAALRQVEPISDVLLIHPYFNNPYFDDGEDLLDAYAEVAAESGKPLLTTEVCWGSPDDAERVKIIHATLSTLRRRKLGWLAYVLHHSLIIDSHRAEYGPTNEWIGSLHFIEADGSLRPGHEAFNEY